MLKTQHSRCRSARHRANLLLYREIVCCSCFDLLCAVCTHVSALLPYKPALNGLVVTEISIGQFNHGGLWVLDLSQRNSSGSSPSYESQPSIAVVSLLRPLIERTFVCTAFALINLIYIAVFSTCMVYFIHAYCSVVPRRGFDAPSSSRYVVSFLSALSSVT